MSKVTELQQKIASRHKTPALVDNVASTLITMNMPVAIGVSGGKDSGVAAWAVINHLDRVGHTGPRILIHSHLGGIEWRDSLPVCEQLSDRLETPLVVVSRAAGGMVERWRGRWESNLCRYLELSCVKMILPWSTPSMRFCTSELKTAIICRKLRALYPGTIMLSASGVRWQESSKRAEKEITSGQAKLDSPGTSGYDWNPILHWTEHEVWQAHHYCDLPVHEAYRVYNSSRVSCSFCIMSSLDDLIKSSSCPENQAVYRELVDLECDSAFQFQSNRWLGDTNPALLSDSQLLRLEQAKVTMAKREYIESHIPESLLFKKGWPDRVPSYSEAVLLAHARSEMQILLKQPVQCTDAVSLMARYETLIRLRDEQDVRRTLKAEQVARRITV